MEKYNEATFDELMKDPNGVAKVRAMLTKERSERNTMTISEFDQYLPLFRFDGKDELPEREYLTLHLAYMQRICRFDPVTIVDDEHTQVILVLPAMFNRTVPMNALGDVGKDISQGFINACQLPDEITNNPKRAKYANQYRHLFDMAQDHKAHEQHKQLAAEMSAKVLQITNNTNTTTPEIKPEIEEISSYDLKEIQPISSSTPVQSGIESYGGDEEIEYL